ncbi:hypothetical protein BurJ1DRAFT_0481 [Burkholderiales bacterium JOSHI_001]|nr:hypothetical protein BurJ1DRAFT_0481 [Burkholderiales bacterium JOSHI_001]
MTASPVSPWLVDETAPRGHRVRRLLATALWRASQALSRLATRVAAPPSTASAPQTLPRLEFHGSGAAPEGALYVDGVLFGHLEGVTRL